MPLTEQIRSNRELFLKELRTGPYKKGCTQSDEKGLPIIASPADDDGMCACAIMIHLFPKSGVPNFKFAKESLGIKGPDCRYIQNDLNDTALTFPEIADRIENDVFALKISKNTPFSKVQEYYPDAMKGVFTTDKPMEYMQQGLYNIYRGINLPENYAKCLYRLITPIAGGYKNVYIFSKAESGRVDFRFHTGSLSDSMKTKVIVNSIEQLLAVIEKKYGKPVKGELEFTSCRWDERINWLSYNVVGEFEGESKHVIGQSNGRFIKS